MKKIILLVCLLTLVGCGEIEPVTVTIIDTYKETTGWGCIGTNQVTVVKTQHGNVAKVCGKWGEVGETFSGWWRSGHFDPIANGFRLTN